MSDRNWTVMVYLAGDNNLSEECVYALTGMKRASKDFETNNGGARSTNQEPPVRVIAQLDASGLGGVEPRYVITARDDLKEDQVTTRDTTETSYRFVLKDFISWGLKSHQANHYMVVLSGHGKGAEEDFLSKDADPPDALSIPKLQWILEGLKQQYETEFNKAEGKIDILGMDSCMMSMAEVCYELRKHVKYIIGAEGYEPNTGWPYLELLDELQNNSNSTPCELAITIVKKYIEVYKDYIVAGRSVDQAACDLGMCDVLVEAMKKLSAALIEQLKAPTSEGRRAILLAHWEAQSYKDDQYIDLYDFCDLLEKGSDIFGQNDIPENLKKACAGVKAVLDKMILISCFSGPAVQHSHGLSVYFPWSIVSENYRDLEFAQATDWYDFLVEYVKRTRRDARRDAVPPTKFQQESHLYRSSTGSGFDFVPELGLPLPSENRDNWPRNRDNWPRNRYLGNKAGSMKNPATNYYDCVCREKPGLCTGTSSSVSADNQSNNTAKKSAARQVGTGKSRQTKKSVK